MQIHHSYQNSTLPLNINSEYLENGPRSNLLTFFFNEHMPLPPLSETLRQLVDNELDKALTSMAES